MRLLYTLGILLLLSSCAQQKGDDLDDEVGLMLYTIRDQMKDDPKEKLERVASIGYDYIESVGYENGTYYGMAPADFKQFMDSIDLEPMSSHHGSMTYENADKEIADAVAAGFEFGRGQSDLRPCLRQLVGRNASCLKGIHVEPHHGG